MALNSIQTNISAYYAQQNIGKASTSASLSVSRLSSGNRIVNAADDVAALAAGTALKSQVTTLRTALLNASQGASLLQVADGTLSQIVDILQRQKAIAVQASSGSIDNTQRGFLNQEFQALSSEIDRLADSTNFNGVKLLDGSVFGANAVETTSTQATAGLATFTTSAANFASNDAVSFTLGASTVTFTFTTSATSGQVTTGGTVAASIDNFITAIRASTSTVLAGYDFSRTGNNLIVTAKAGGLLASQGGGIIIDGATGGGLISSDAVTTAATKVYELNNAADDGLGQGSVSVSGNVGDPLLVTLDNTKAKVTLDFGATGTFAQIAAADTIAVGGITFTFTTTAAATDATQIVIGSNLGDTLNNIVQTLNGYTTSTASGTAPTVAGKYSLGQLNFSRVGNTVVIEGKQAGSVYTNAAVPAVASVSVGGIANVTGAASLTGTKAGVNVNGIANKDFVGTISGFTATYVSSDTVNLSVEIGDSTYTANSVDTTTTGSTATIAFTSADGGSFNVDFAVGQGTTVTNQTTADTFAARLNAAFSGLTFSQTRSVSNYSGVGSILTGDGTNIGSLVGSSVQAHLPSFSSVNLNSVTVNAPAVSGGTGSIEVTIDGEVFSSGQIATKIGANALVRLTSTSDPTHYIDFRGPSTTSNDPAAVTAIDFGSAEKASSVQSALENAFGLTSGGQSLEFQVGNSVTDILSVSIGTATTHALYGDTTVDVTTQSNASAASGIVDQAINRVISIRADVGALQSRFNFASAAINSSIQNQDAARGTLLDTDVATESTNYATSQVQLQAGIAVLAQANQLPQNLLKLIG